MTVPPLRQGWIVNVDIVGYSLKTHELQRDLATFLIRSVESTYLFRNRLHGSEQYCLICTGDGFILVVADDLLRDHGGLHVFRFVEELQSMVSTYERSLAHDTSDGATGRDFKIRTGLHRGAFTFEEILGQRNAIGTGINIATRVTSGADPGQILASSAVYEHVEDYLRQQAEIHLTFVGEIRVKHNVSIAVYTYYRDAPGGDSKSAPAFGTDDNPKCIKREIRIDDTILGLLSSLVQDVSKLVEAAGVTAREAALRVSLLAPTKRGRAGSEKEYLVVTAYRYVHNEPSVSTGVAYRIDGAHPQGVSAEAYCRNAPQVATQLPDRFTDFDGYADKLKAHNLAKGDITGFRRPCRAYVAVPFSTLLSTETRFVLTLDSMHPLFPEDSAQVREIIEKMKGITQRLGLLLELKGSVVGSVR